MKIKDPEVDAMARELAARRSTAVTNAVRQALSAELERSHHEEEEMAGAVEPRRARLLELLQSFRQIQWPEGVNSKQLQDELYGDPGLPV